MLMNSFHNPQNTLEFNKINVVITQQLKVEYFLPTASMDVSK